MRPRLRSRGEPEIASDSVITNPDASMRPRLRSRGERFMDGRLLTPKQQASMRPRLRSRGEPQQVIDKIKQLIGFNAATVEVPWRTHTQLRSPHADGQASMRPRLRSRGEPSY